MDLSHIYSMDSEKFQQHLRFLRSRDDTEMRTVADSTKPRIEELLEEAQCLCDENDHAAEKVALETAMAGVYQLIAIHAELKRRSTQS